MLLRKQNAVHVQKQTERTCCKKCGYNASFLICNQVVHTITTIIGGLCVYALSLTIFYIAATGQEV